jgi:hypothetical protein
MNRSARLALTAFIVGFLMLVSPSPVYSVELGPVQASITCANETGEVRTIPTGWDPRNRYFEGKGDIARLFCEGGHAGTGWTIYVSDTLDPQDPRRYYNGIIPTPEPTIEPTPSLEPTPTPEPEPTPLPSLTAEPEPSIEPTSTPVEPIQIEPTPEALVTPTQLPPPPVTQEIPPTPTPTPTPEPTSEPTPTPTPTPTIEPSPTPIISAPTEVEPTPTPTNPQEVTIQLSPTLEAIPGAAQLVAAAEAIMNIGADMTDEQRDEAQTVAVSALIVTQLAQVRKIK